MPPKNKLVKAPTIPSTSRELVPTGPKHVSRKHAPKRDENGDKPTTARALVLRNGKYGARGTGEVVLVTKLTGREKLDLLAGKLSVSIRLYHDFTFNIEDLIESSKKAILRPFRLDDCLKIAESQSNGTWFLSMYAKWRVEP